MGTSGGISSAIAGTFASLQAPEATTTVRASQFPWSVRTSNPSSAGFTEVTLVSLRTGASVAVA